MLHKKDINKLLFETLTKAGMPNIEMTTISALPDSPVSTDKTRDYLVIQSDYMLSMSGTLNNEPSMKFELIREDIGLVIRLVEMSIENMISLRNLLSEVIAKQSEMDVMYR